MLILDFTFAFLFCVLTLGFVDLEIRYSGGHKFKWVGWISRIVRYKENKNRTKYAEVVRCVDCKYYNNTDIKLLPHCTLCGITKCEDDFCSCGERREGE